MMKRITRSALLFLLCGISFYGQEIDHATWTAILQKHVSPQSRVDYVKLKAEDTAALDSYLAGMARPWPEQMPGESTKAALINVYNALTLRWIIANYPVESIWRTADPFRVSRHQVNGKTESLDSIETRLRDLGDPRIHAALVCAARSCPPLRREAYIGASLNEQLDDNFRQWLSDPARNQFLSNQKLARVSQIFQWYQGDFDKAGGVPLFLARFAPPQSFAAANKLEYEDYNWGLNDSGDAGASYSEWEFRVDYARNGYLKSDIEGWFLGLGEKYGVNPVIFGSIYVGAIPFFSLSIAWTVRNLRRGKSAAIPLLAAAFCFVSAYLYLLVAGKNIPAWVYFFIAGMLIFGVWSTVRKVKARISPEGKAA